MLPGFIVSVCNNAVVPDPVPAPASAAYRSVDALISSRTSPGPYPIGRLFSFQGALCKRAMFMNPTGLAKSPPTMFGQRGAKKEVVLKNFFIFVYLALPCCKAAIAFVSVSPLTC